jgi:hypothetical protein
MTPLNAEELTLDLEDAPAGIRVIWQGRSNSRDPGKVLGPWFDTLLDEAERTHRPVEMQFGRLEHFNSSTISALIQLINQARDRRVRLSLVYDKGLKWQALSFDALKRALRPFDDGEASPVTIVPG